jgi:magnesium transporter
MDHDHDQDGVSNVTSPVGVLSPHIDDVKSERQSDLLSPAGGMSYGIEAADRLLTNDRKKIVDFIKYEEICEQKELKIFWMEENGNKIREYSEEQFIERLVKENMNNEADGLLTHWIDIQYPSSRVLKKLAKKLDIHPLTIEDCLHHRETREKNEFFDDYRFIVLNEIHFPPGSNELEKLPINIILTQNTVITTHLGPVKTIDQVLDRLRQLVGRRRHSDWVLYAVFDSIIDMFWTYVQQGIMEASSLDDLVLILSAHEQNDLLRRIGMARRRVMYLRAQLLRKKDLLLGLLAKSHAQKKNQIDPTSLSRNTKVYLRDVLDHVTTMLEDVESTKEAIGNLNAIYLARVSIEVARVSNRMNSVMKTYSAVATIFLPLTLVTGLFGMNVRVPGGDITGEIAWFFVILGAIVAGGVVALSLFKRFKWL